MFVFQVGINSFLSPSSGFDVFAIFFNMHYDEMSEAELLFHWKDTNVPQLRARVTFGFHEHWREEKTKNSIFDHSWWSAPFFHLTFHYFALISGTVHLRITYLSLLPVVLFILRQFWRCQLWRLLKIIHRPCCEHHWRAVLSVLNYTRQPYQCMEGSEHLLTDKRLLLVTAWDGNINGALLGWAVTLASSVKKPVQLHSVFNS